MSIATLAPLPQAEFDEAICTFHSPSKPAAEACVAKGIASSTRMRAAIVSLRKCPMVPPVFWTPRHSHSAARRAVRGVTLTNAQTKAPPERGFAFGADV